MDKISIEGLFTNRKYGIIRGIDNIKSHIYNKYNRVQIESELLNCSLSKKW